ncbi:hypothetical protein EJV47_25465 [Hymenobacter gummosus]|uniref:Uncharacterized protein n=1 Tax=Hymenobacter gummosus TaxID=1776032 RepID=A0A431TVE1_9BACT|nr:hypothetical protein [Hymenobacter gummosus]RTQ45229.1 hypothetical protein EJV47_25465 [Hymenobacter gummosus]
MLHIPFPAEVNNVSKPAVRPPKDAELLLGIAWRLLLPLLTLALLFEAEDWLQPLPPLGPVAPTHPAPADPLKTAVAVLPAVLGGLAQVLPTLLLWLLGTAVFLVLLLGQAFLSPLPWYHRHLHGRAWRFALPGLAAGLCWLQLLAATGFVWLTWFKLGSAGLALTVVGLLEWATKPAGAPAA